MRDKEREREREREREIKRDREKITKLYTYKNKLYKIVFKKKQHSVLLLVPVSNVPTAVVKTKPDMIKIERKHVIYK